MKTILLAGGLGTRLSEETVIKPKPMVEIGGMPILLHIMSLYAAHGFDQFVIACGYLGHVIKEYFCDYRIKHSDWVINLRTGDCQALRSVAPDWSIWAVDTGKHSMTGGRVRRLRSVVGNETFMVTYGDGLGDVDLTAVVDFHRRHGRLATVTAVHPPARFGCIELAGDQVIKFAEKPQTSEGWINGGFFVFEPGVFSYLDGDDTVLEREPLERLAQDGQLMAYQHDGFWQPMDTLRDKQMLEKLWDSGKAPWKVWSDNDAADDSLFPETGADHWPDRVQRRLAG
jgi:glucose-1-phosphate cytidylyltransferase